jgi:hypothetical protein
MDSRSSRSAQAVLTSLQAAEISARGGFGCLFSTSEEFEMALITERRAQGRYAQRRMRWPVILFVGCALMVAGTVLVFG